MTLLSPFATSTGVFCFVPILKRLVESGIVPKSTAPRLADLPTPAPATPPRQIPPEAADCKPPQTPRADAWSPAIVCPLLLPPVGSPAPPTPTGAPSPTFAERASASFTSDSTLCDGCHTLLRRDLDIPPDHIPSVIRALALFETQDRLFDAALDECDVAALTSAFAMLRI